MTYRLSVLKDKPSRLWMLDDSAPYKDYSGYNSTGGDIYSGAPSTGVPLVKQAAFSTVFSSVGVGTFGTTVYKQGQENGEFALEAWVLLKEGTSGPVSILSHSGNYDGLTINGKTLTFQVDFVGADSAVVQYTHPWARKFHVVGVYNGKEIQLWINGVRKDAVDLTDEQKNATFPYTFGTMLCGQTATNAQIQVNAIASYKYALHADRIHAHFTAGQNVTNSHIVPAIYGGTATQLVKEEGDIFAQDVWDDPEDWYHPEIDDASGQWLGVFPLDTGIVAEDAPGNVIVPGLITPGNIVPSASGFKIAGVELDWEGQNVTVEASLDDSTWETAQRSTRLGIVPNGTDPSAKDLTIRVTFTGNAPEKHDPVEPDDSYIDWLTATGFSTLEAPALSNRTVTLSPQVSLRNDSRIFAFTEAAGFYLNGGTVTIGPDQGVDATGVRTVEVWVKRLSNVPLSLGITGTQYRNGVPFNSTANVNEWCLLHVVSGSAVTGNIVISGDAVISQIAIYPTALTSTQIQELYKLYTGRISMSLTSSSSLAATVNANSADISSYDWSITGAGG